MKNKIIIICIICISLITYNLHISYKNNYIEKEKIVDSINSLLGYEVPKNNLYDMVLSIPVINIEKGLYLFGNSKNNLNETVMIHESSIMPNIDNSNLILLGHSGTGKTAHFNNLLDLKKDHLVYIYYNNTKYTYIINDIYEITKAGKASIIRDEFKKTITLITCSQKDKSKQIIYIGYLIDEI